MITTVFEQAELPLFRKALFTETEMATVAGDKKKTR
jgi:hypothetical protein